MNDIKLSDGERLILANQYRILARLYPEEADRHLLCVDILQRGFSAFYGDVFGNIQEEMTRKDREHVVCILRIYEALQNSYAKLHDKSEIDASALRFPGFDGNRESQMLGFARALRESGRFDKVETVTPNLDSHHLQWMEYRRMINTWRTFGSPSELTKLRIRRILSASSQPDEDD